jgi:hypothetical protein
MSEEDQVFIIDVDTAWLHPNFFPSVLQTKPLYLPHSEKKDEEGEIREVAINVELADGRMGVGAGRRACTRCIQNQIEKCE